MSKKIKKEILLVVAPIIAHLMTRIIHLTMRITYVNYDRYRQLSAEGRQSILAFWHSRILMMPYGYPGKVLTTLVSAHKDGELIARTVRPFGILCVRGSSTRGWFKGLRGVLQSVKDGRDIAITPDGPKGPARRAQMGALQIARSTGLPVMPVSFGASKKKPFPAGTLSYSRTHSLAASLSAANLSI
ncbi:MAG: DUF374 domain-containing protein [Proteobacteria bacterium]|nr:DUF374 domain-containing protein [Pseudomonadota bacterium]